MSTFVAVDIETTGLDARRDAILEVAVISFDAEGILEEWSTLVNPYQDIPEFVVNLTGITPDMVADAPDMYAVKRHLQSLVADHVVVGHNVDFDMSFLTAESVGVGNARLDTVTLASILFPAAGRFGLDALANYLELPAPGGKQAHRAREDARLTVDLFLALQAQARQIPFDLLEEIVAAGQRIGWRETLFFEQALIDLAQRAFTDGRPSGRQHRLFRPTRIEGQLLVPEETPRAIDTELVAAMIEPQGNFSRTFPAFEHRPQQVTMLRAVADAFNQGAHLLVEAGTGTGKSVGYLLPAAFWAVENERTVVISTNTINLQDQLLNKDIPQLQRCLPFPLRAAVRKGRRNYICTRLFRQLRHSGPSSADEMTLFARLLLWLPTTDNGDMAEVTLRTAGERLAWAKLNGDNLVCRSDDCAQESCPLYVARRRAEMAHLLVVNHALLLSDVANNNHILPPFQDLIIDEGHHLESAVTDGLAFRADQRYIKGLLDELSGTRSGLLSDVAGRTRNLPAAFLNVIDNHINALRNGADRAHGDLDDFFASLTYFLQEFIRPGATFAQQVRVLPGLREQGGFGHVAMSWDNLSRLLRAIGADVGRLAQGLEDLVDTMDIDEGEELALAVAHIGRQLEETRSNIDQVILNPLADTIYWFEQSKEHISIHAAPLHVGPLVAEHIFGAKETVIVTSATLRTAGRGRSDEPTFDYVRDRLHAFDALEMGIGSPFDYENNTLLYLCSDIPEPNQPGYQRYLESAIVDVATALGGRTMVLFTSYSQLNQTARAIAGDVTGAGLQLLVQGESLSRQQLLAQFSQEDAGAILLGTRSFWEGVDVPGDALQAVLIAKLPFDVPSDPIVAARSETFERPFFEYSVPEAVLRFRQGFGRLIRRKSDEGVVAVLDKRILTKRYGNLFLEALPPCMVLRQRTERLGELTLRWLNRERP